MKKIKIIFVVSSLFLSFSALHSQNDGAANTGLAFLKLGVSSRSIALGEAVVSMSDDPSATHYNPALLLYGGNNGFLFMHNASVLGTRTEFLAAKFKAGKLAFGVSINNTAVNDIEIREIPGSPIGTFDAQNYELGFSGAFRFNNYLSFGITAKFLYEKIYVDNADGYAFDFGGLYRDGNLSVGGLLANFGSMNKMRSQETKLPSLFRFGASYLFGLKNISSSLRVALDFNKVIDGGNPHMNAGAEFLFKNFLAMRAGYQSGYEDRNLTTGVGLKYKAFSLDYAFVPYKYSLGNSHTFTLVASF